MVKFSETVGAGRRAEQEVLQVLRGYSRAVYSNVKVDTLLTKSGVTEIDIVAAVGAVILVVEVKNVSLMEGSIGDNYWTMTGLETGREYSSLSPLVQNRIHVHSLKNAWHIAHGDIPIVVSCVVVPNSCVCTEEQKAAGILTVQEFQRQLVELSAPSPKCRYAYTLDFLFGNHDRYLKRSDFVEGL